MSKSKNNPATNTADPLAAMSGELMDGIELPEVETQNIGEDENGNVIESTGIVEFDQVRSSLTAMRESMEKLPDATTSEGYALIKSAVSVIVKARNAGDKARLAATAGLRNEVSRINDMWNNDIEPELKALEAIGKAPLKVVDDEKKRLKEEAEAKEAARLAAIEEHFRMIENMQGVFDLEHILTSLDTLNNLSLDVFDERGQEGELAITNMLNVLNQRKREQEQLAADRAELAEAKRIADEAEQQRLAHQKVLDDAHAAETQKLADAQAELQRERDELAESKRQAEQAEQKRLDDIKHAEELKAAEVQAAEDARIAEAARIAQEAKDKAAQEEADKAEAARLLSMQPAAEQLRVWFDGIADMPSFNLPEDDVVDVVDQLQLSMANMDVATTKLLNKTKAGA